MYQPGSRQNRRNTFKQCKQIFLWANIDNDLMEKGVENKKMLKFVKDFDNEPVKTRTSMSRLCNITYRN